MKSMRRWSRRWSLTLAALLPGVAAAAGTNAAELVSLGIEDAVLMGLERNRSLQVESFHVPIRREREQRARARFDTAIAAELAAGRNTVSTGTPDSGDETTLQSIDARVELERTWPSGTGVSLEGGLRREATPGADERQTARIGLTATQALLRGAGTTVNRVAIRQAEIETRSSRYELRGFTEALVARMEEAYWDLGLAGRNLKIVREAAQLASQQLEEVEKKVNVGVLAPTELAAARAEAALRKGALIGAQGDFERARLALLHFLNPPAEQPWELSVELLDTPSPDMSPPDAVGEHVALAVTMRPDLNQARLALERGDLEVTRTRNGTLPRLDLFVRLGRTAYADSFGAAFDHLGDAEPDISAGLQWSQTLGRRAERASYRESALARLQAEAAVINMEKLVEFDVRKAHIEVQQADEQILAAVTIKNTHAEKLRAEMEKFQVGRSTALLVAQAQRELMNASLAEQQALLRAVRARIDLHRLDGSLLQRRGIVMAESS